MTDQNGPSLADTFNMFFGDDDDVAICIYCKEEGNDLIEAQPGPAHPDGHFYHQVCEDREERIRAAAKFAFAARNHEQTQRDEDAE